MDQIIDIYLRLHANEAEGQAPPMEVILHTQPSFSRSLQDLIAAANTGQGLKRPMNPVVHQDLDNDPPLVATTDAPTSSDHLEAPDLTHEEGSHPEGGGENDDLVTEDEDVGRVEDNDIDDPDSLKQPEVHRVPSSSDTLTTDRNTERVSEDTGSEHLSGKDEDNEVHPHTGPSNEGNPQSTTLNFDSGESLHDSSRQTKDRTFIRSPSAHLQGEYEASEATWVPQMSDEKRGSLSGSSTIRDDGHDERLTELPIAENEEEDELDFEEHEEHAEKGKVSDTDHHQPNLDEEHWFANAGDSFATQTQTANLPNDPEADAEEETFDLNFDDVPQSVVHVEQDRVKEAPGIEESNAEAENEPAPPEDSGDELTFDDEVDFHEEQLAVDALQTPAGHENLADQFQGSRTGSPNSLKRTRSFDEEDLPASDLTGGKVSPYKLSCDRLTYRGDAKRVRHDES